MLSIAANPWSNNGRSNPNKVSESAKEDFWEDFPLTSPGTTLFTCEQIWTRFLEAVMALNLTIRRLLAIQSLKS